MPAGYLIRDMTDYDEIRQCVAIQERTWGPGFSEAVPAAVLWVATRTGGVVAGAFRDDGALVGFVFGMSGFRDGQPLHWSDLLAVLPEERGAGLGVALKAHQRRVLLDAGIRDMFWTFDPLVSRNAYVNFARLGAIAREYIPDCYGRTTSPLHAGLATDRLVVHWRLSSPRVRQRMDEGFDDDSDEWPGAADSPVINEDPGTPRLELDGELLRLRIPGDIQALKAQQPARAEAWQATVRQAFMTYLAQGYVVVDLLREEDGSSYVLTRGRAALAALS